MIVTDTNVIAHLHIPGKFTDDAEALFKLDRQWLVPLLWRSEFRSILFQFMKHGRMTLSDAVRTDDMAVSLLQADEFSLPTRPVLQLSEQTGCTPYDCEFVALALYHGIPLITSDKAVLKAFPDTAHTITGYVGL